MASSPKRISTLLGHIMRGKEPQKKFVHDHVAPGSGHAGVGAGTKDFTLHANIVRVVIGNTSSPAAAHTHAPPAHHHHVTGVVRQPPTSQTPALSSPVSPRSIQLSAVAEPPLVPSAEAPASACAEGPWSLSALTELSCNLDDMDPEASSFALDRLLSTPGVLDVWYSPAQMKKGRGAALTLHVLVDPPAVGPVLQAVFRHTPTLGVRIQQVQRAALGRTMQAVETPFGQVRVKVGQATPHSSPEYMSQEYSWSEASLMCVASAAQVATMGEEVVNVKPEFEDCKVGRGLAIDCLPHRRAEDFGAMMLMMVVFVDCLRHRRPLWRATCRCALSVTRPEKLWQPRLTLPTARKIFPLRQEATEQIGLSGIRAFIGDSTSN